MSGLGKTGVGSEGTATPVVSFFETVLGMPSRPSRFASLAILSADYPTEIVNKGGLGLSQHRRISGLQGSLRTGKSLFPFAAICMRWEHLLRPVLGPFSRAFEARVAIKRANQRFAHINHFIGEINERFSQYIAPGLIGSEGASLTAWSREGDHIVSSLRLKSLRKQEMIVPLRIKVGTDQVKIGEVSLLLSDSEGILGVITRTVFGFFST